MLLGRATMKMNTLIFFLSFMLLLTRSGSINLRDGCTLQRGNYDYLYSTLGEENNKKSLEDATFLCKLLSYSVSITYAMLNEPLVLVSDLSVLCDLNVDIRLAYSLNGQRTSCYFGITFHVLDQIVQTAKQEKWSGISRVVSSTLMLSAFLREYTLADMQVIDGFSHLRQDLTPIWKPKVALFFIFTEEVGFESCSYSTASQLYSSRNNGSKWCKDHSIHVITALLEQLIATWGDKSMWVDLVLYIDYQPKVQIRQQRPQGKDRSQSDCPPSTVINCPEILLLLSDDLSGIINGVRCVQTPSSCVSTDEQYIGHEYDLLVQDAYDTGAEYFYFPAMSNSQLNYFQDGWLIHIISALRGSPFARNVGVVIQGEGCTKGFSTGGSIREVKSMAFHRTHIDIIRALSDINNHDTKRIAGYALEDRNRFGHKSGEGFPETHSGAMKWDGNSSTRMNKLVVIEAYGYFGSIICPSPALFDLTASDIDSQIISSEQDVLYDSSPFQLGVYIDRVQTLRLSIATWVQSHFPLLNVEWTEEMIAYQRGDLFYDLYCSYDVIGDLTISATSPHHSICVQRGSEKVADIPYEAMFQSSKNRAKIVFITAIYGNYEKTVKRFVRQTIPTDFICFTDNPKIRANGWIVDTIPYHDLIQHPGNDGSIQGINTLQNNRHPFNIAKFYKTAFRLIPRLMEYDIVVWLDGTVELMNEETSEYVSELINRGENFIVFEHHRGGRLEAEVRTSLLNGRYDTTQLNGIPQPRQDLNKQYTMYVDDGFEEKSSSSLQHLSVGTTSMSMSGSGSRSGSGSGSGSWWDRYSDREEYGVFVTCFLGMNMRNQTTHTFLDLWYAQIIQHSTQDQVSFPHIAQMQYVHPYPLPDHTVIGDSTMNTLFQKHGHGL